MSKPMLSAEDLRTAALDAARRAGSVLEHAGRSKIEQLYVDAVGKRWRIRTSNDRVLTVTASSPDPGAAILDIEGCDFILLAMPNIKRGAEKIEVYVVPADVAVDAVRVAHSIWLKSSAKTNGRNQTFSIWFDEAIAESGMFRDRWSQYRLQ